MPPGREALTRDVQKDDKSFGAESPAFEDAMVVEGRKPPPADFSRNPGAGAPSADPAAAVRQDVVDRIRREIRNGKYAVKSEKIAEKIIANGILNRDE